MDKLLRLYFIQTWILFILLANVESYATRAPNDCGKSETFEVRYFGDLTSDIERFTTAYQGVLWNIYYVRDDRYSCSLNFIFPNKPEDNVEITTQIRTSTDESYYEAGRLNTGIIGFKYAPKPTSQYLRGVEFQLTNVEPFTKEHSNFTMKFQIQDYWDGTIIHDECSVKNVPVEEVICDPPRTAPTNGNVTCTNTNKYASICTYTCNDGYVLSNISLATTTCKAVGVSTAGVWSSVPPQCEVCTDCTNVGKIVGIVFGLLVGIIIIISIVGWICYRRKKKPKSKNMKKGEQGTSGERVPMNKPATSPMPANVPNDANDDSDDSDNDNE